MTKICFVHCVNKELSQTQMFGIHYMPVWIYTLIPHIKEIGNFKYEIYDNRISNSILPKADYYFFSGINQDLADIKLLATKIKNTIQKSKLIIGGPITWSLDQAQQIHELDIFNHVLIGDGENIIKPFIKSLINNEHLDKIIKSKTKFALSSAKMMDTELMDKTIQHYYGGIVEVSRGCPFLCEFCDIRIQIDNNRPHSKSINLIIQEINYFAKKGISQILFACDNFIGDPLWAESVCDAIIEWQNESNLSIKIYTWLTINLANHPKLLFKMKAAGFDMLFIGIESFGTNQLLETAKIQNVKTALSESVKIIQSYGFIVVAGLIFGFDSDPEDVAKETLDGICESGIITGDPSLLIALPGTPLFKRMKYSNRLREGKKELGGSKFSTNIKYLKSTERIIQDIQYFVREFNKGKYQYKRLLSYYENLNPDYYTKSNKNSSYISPIKYLLLLLKNPRSILPFIKRFILLISSIERLYYISLAAIVTTKFYLNKKYLFQYFNLWIFMWSNSILKYRDIKSNDFDIDSVGDNYNFSNLIPEQYINDFTEPIPLTKIKAQRNLTIQALTKLRNRINAK